MPMREPRLYLYRKAGRSVWDAEMWLPDGRRTTWRTGLPDRDQAEHAARERLKRLIGAWAPPRDAPAVEAAPAPRTDIRPDGGAPGSESAAPAGAETAGGWLERLDAWFFADLEKLFAET
jgi:hypothetical protein